MSVEASESVEFWPSKPEPNLFPVPTGYPQNRDEMTDKASDSKPALILVSMDNLQRSDMGVFVAGKLDEYHEAIDIDSLISKIQGDTPTTPQGDPPKEELPYEPRGEAKNETVSPNSLESGKDLEIDGSDNSHELSIKINEPKAGNGQEQAPPNEISKTIMTAPDPTATTTSTKADTDKDDADYVLKVSAPFFAVSAAVILSYMKYPPS
ncbi:hypothetical protein QJS10_CPA09g01058 [Acorus calamus]|uniref:Uncharacterized protein n=1 Tax=Acorus calamus TaxID=4465 RepID=A0AAV9E414_ACOCL|nr:hypothetical protein QJS10_CPA09g01058 [Acorus calamus]